MVRAAASVGKLTQADLDGLLSSGKHLVVPVAGLSEESILQLAVLARAGNGFIEFVIDGKDVPAVPAGSIERAILTGRNNVKFSFL